MDRRKILEEIRLKSLTVNKYIKENKAPVMVSPAAAAGSSSGGGGGAVSESTDAIVTAFLKAANISDSTIESSLDTFVKTMKDESLWDKVLVFYPLVTDKLDSNDIFEQFKFNLVNPNEYKLNPADSKFDTVTVASTGISDFGNTNTLTTGFTPSSSPTNFDDEGELFSILAGGYYLRTTTDTVYSVISQTVGGNSDFAIRIDSISPKRANLRWPLSVDNSYTDALPDGIGNAGTFMISGDQYPGEGGFAQYRLDILTGIGFAQPDSQISITGDSPFTLGDTGGLANCANEISAYFLMEAKLSQAQMTTVRDAVNQLQTDLGRATH